MRRKRNLSSRIESCAHLLIPCPGELRGRWRNSFGFDRIYLEIGCGKGGFINHQARTNPDILFIAMEKAENVIITALEKAEQYNPGNLRFINAPAENLGDYFDRREVSKVYINFCDPWPATRHIKRRLVSSRFLYVYNNILESGGEIHFMTDNTPLFQFALREFEICDFTVIEAVNNLHKHCPDARNIENMTEYEQKFYNEGVPVHRCIAIKDENT